MITKQDLDRAKSIRLLNPELGNPIYYRVAIGWKNPSSSLNDYNSKEVIETAAAWEVHEWEDQPSPEPTNAEIMDAVERSEPDYQTQIDELKEQVHRANAKMADCKKDGMAMYNSISDCEATINKLSGRLSKLKNENSEENAKNINSLFGSFFDLSAKVQRIEAELTRQKEEKAQPEPPRLEWGKIPEDVLQKWCKLVEMEGIRSRIKKIWEDKYGVNFHSKLGETLLITQGGRSFTYNDNTDKEVEWPIVRLIDQMRADGLEFKTGHPK